MSSIGKKINILAVDDKVANLVSIESILRSPELNIIRAHSGNEALGILLENEFACILIDVKMPDMDGFELAKIIRGDERSRYLPILFVSGHQTGEVDILKGYELGAVDFLTKPLEIIVVKSKVNFFVDLFKKDKLIKEAHSQLKQSNDELEERVRNRTRELEMALRVRDEFLSIASHELKTPLTSLLLQLQMTQRAIKPNQKLALSFEKLAGSIQLEIRQAKALSNLIEDLLDTSRIQIGSFALTLEEVNLSDVATDVIARLSEQLSAAGCKPELILNSKIRGNWDKQRLEQVITNLISNAMKYANGPTRIITSSDQDRAVLTVEDHGPGIAKEHQNKIFERFERMETDRHTGGLGLGLYIVKRIVEAHHGSIHVESEKGKGSRFIVELPFSSSYTDH